MASWEDKWELAFFNSCLQELDAFLRSYLSRICKCPIGMTLTIFGKRWEKLSFLREKNPSFSGMRLRPLLCAATSSGLWPRQGHWCMGFLAFQAGVICIIGFHENSAQGEAKKHKREGRVKIHNLLNKLYFLEKYYNAFRYESAFFVISHLQAKQQECYCCALPDDLFFCVEEDRIPVSRRPGWTGQNNSWPNKTEKWQKVEANLQTFPNQILPLLSVL